MYGTPELIFLDEPTTGLDIQSRGALRDTVDTLREAGSTIVLTTHYLAEAQQRADRAGFMHKGAFPREGTVRELTQTLPAETRLSLPDPAPAPPLHSARESDGPFLVETFGLQKNLHLVPGWVGTLVVASWVGFGDTEDTALPERALPGGSASELVVNAWDGGVPLADSLPLLAPTLGWVVAAAARAPRIFRWEPRR